jgi:orotidine-5'-phosphate decarboxylase
MKSLVENSENTDIISVVRMSSDALINRYYKETARKSVNCGVKGVVVGATQPKYIREVRNIVDSSMYICSPGIGYQGGDAKTALRNGTDYLIVGRDILKADDPREKAKEYLELLNL